MTHLDALCALVWLGLAHLHLALDGVQVRLLIESLQIFKFQTPANFPKIFKKLGHFLQGGDLRRYNSHAIREVLRVTLFETNLSVFIYNGSGRGLHRERAKHCCRLSLEVK